jgi:CheY-like chemotaxis protein
MTRLEILSYNPGDEIFSAGETEAPPQRILIAEDNEVVRELAREILEFLGFMVSAAENGKLALQLALQQTFDLILMDCQMPVLDGIEATRQFRGMETESGRGKTPIVGLSGHPIAEGRESCLAAGMDDYLQKPFTISELQEIINNWIPSPRS